MIKLHSCVKVFSSDYSYHKILSSKNIKIHTKVHFACSFVQKYSPSNINCYQIQIRITVSIKIIKIQDFYFIFNLRNSCSKSFTSLPCIKCILQYTSFLFYDTLKKLHILICIYLITFFKIFTILIGT